MSSNESKNSNLKEAESASINSVTHVPYPESSSQKSNIFRSFVDSFKRLEPEIDESQFSPDMTDEEKRQIALKNTPLQKSLKSRHLQMISIGGSVGTGLFVGSGTALRTGGAASLPIAWGIVGSLLYCVIHALGELQLFSNVPGAFSAHATRFIDPSFGFAIGYNYVILWLVVLPAEIIAASITIGYWSDITPTAWVTIFYVAIISINMFGVRGYGEAEYIFSLIKVIAILGFLILGIVLVCGGGPSGYFIGGKNYHDPGAFTAGFKGVCTVFVTAVYSVGGSELIGVTGAEAANPRKTLPRAIKQVFWRIMLFYLGSLTLISLLVNATDSRLLGSSSVDAAASPFVIAIQNGGIKGLPSVMNVVILISVLSVGNSAVYGCSRTLLSLSAQGLAPKCFQYVDRMGRPIFGIAANCIIGLLCYLVASDKETVVFTWLMALCGLAIIFTWIAIVLSHIRFRLAMRAQGRSLDELSFRSHAGFWGSVYAFIILVLFLIAQFWVALFPLGSSPDASVFFQSYLGAVIILVFYIGRKLWVRKFNEFIPLTEINLDAGKTPEEIDLQQQEIAEEKELLASKPWWYRTYNLWC